MALFAPHLNGELETCQDRLISTVLLSVAASRQSDVDVQGKEDNMSSIADNMLYHGPLGGVTNLAPRILTDPAGGTMFFTTVTFISRRMSWAGLVMVVKENYNCKR